MTFTYVSALHFVFSVYAFGGEFFPMMTAKQFSSLSFTLESLSVNSQCAVGEALQSEIKIPAVETRSFDTHNILWFFAKKNWKLSKSSKFFIYYFALFISCVKKNFKARKAIWVKKVRHFLDTTHKTPPKNTTPTLLCLPAVINVNIICDNSIIKKVTTTIIFLRIK